MTVEQGLRAVLHDRPKVLARALRAAREQEELNETWHGLLAAFAWLKTKECHPYWLAIHTNSPNPDQYLPEGYVDVEEEVKEQSHLDKVRNFFETTPKEKIIEYLDSIKHLRGGLSADEFLKGYVDVEDEEPKSNLFTHMQEEHGLTLLESELDEIRRIVKNELRHTCQSDVSRRAVEPLVEAIFIIATAPHPANDLDYNSFIETTKRIAQKALDDFNKHYREHTYIPNPQPQNHEQNRIE